MSTPNLPPHLISEVIPLVLGAGGVMAFRMAVWRRSLDSLGLRQMLGRRMLAFHDVAPDQLEQLLSVLAQRVRSWRWILPAIVGMLVCVTLSGITFIFLRQSSSGPWIWVRYAGTVAVFALLVNAFAAAEKWFFALWLRRRLANFHIRQTPCRRSTPVNQ